MLSPVIGFHRGKHVQDSVYRDGLSLILSCKHSTERLNSVWICKSSLSKLLTVCWKVCVWERERVRVWAYVCILIGFTACLHFLSEKENWSLRIISVPPSIISVDSVRHLSCMKSQSWSSLKKWWVSSLLRHFFYEWTFYFPVPIHKRITNVVFLSHLHPLHTSNTHILLALWHFVIHCNPLQLSHLQELQASRSSWR